MAVRGVCGSGGGGGVVGGWGVVCFRGVAGKPVVVWQAKERTRKCLLRR